MLRPELVSNNLDDDGKPIPLCSDGFSGWQSNDPQYRTNNDELRNASRRLYNVIIPDFAKNLAKENCSFVPTTPTPYGFPDSPAEFYKKVVDQIDLIRRIHEKGLMNSF